MFVPYILSWFERNNRVDIVWDVYSKTNLKSELGNKEAVEHEGVLHSQPKAIGLLRVYLNNEEFFVELAKL